jgi:hypothetical protein
MSSLYWFLRSPLAASVLVSLLVGACIMGPCRSGSLEALALAAYAWHIRFRPCAAVSDPRSVLKQTDRVGFSDILMQNLGEVSLRGKTRK